MEWSAIGAAIWSFLNSPQGVIISVTILLYLRTKLFDAKPLWKKYEGFVITAIKEAEKTIDDNTTNPGLMKLNEALRLAVQWIEEAEGRKITNVSEIAELKNGISVIHSELETYPDGLTKNEPVI